MTTSACTSVFTMSFGFRWAFTFMGVKVLPSAFSVSKTCDHRSPFLPDLSGLGSSLLRPFTT